jgi:hypothetical protein
MPRLTTYRLTAHPFERSHGFIQTELCIGGNAPRENVEAVSFAELEAKIAAFGTQHAPCNVWVRCITTPKPRGFDAWNKSATRWLFDAAPEGN